MFGCCLPANTTNKNSVNYRNLNKPFHCNIQSLETWNLRDRDETWNLRDRDRDWDSQKWVSRPRPSLETPSLSLRFHFVLLKQKEDCLQGAQVDSIRKMQLRPSDMVVSPRIVAREYSISRWSVCGPVVFACLQCGLEPRNLDGTNLGSCWCLQRSSRFG